MDVSVIIPSRNEKYLARTCEDILENMRADTEIIPVCNACWPEPPLPVDKRITLVHTTDGIGQRPAINMGAKISRAKYILKCDGHTAFDVGFDEKLMADCESDWVVIPRMYNLNVETWKPKKKKVTDYMWIRSIDAMRKPFRHCYFDAKAHRECPDERRTHKDWVKCQGDISDVMTGQGACFFMHRDWYWYLEGMDEKHGQWGQMGVELACKAWLSGGRQVVNKKTWFAHYFRGGGGPGFPWPASGRKQQKARDYSQDLWTNNKWHKQTRTLTWLVKKFMPLPDWDIYLQSHPEEYIERKDMAKPPKRKKGEIPPYTQEYCKLQLTEDEINQPYKSALMPCWRRRDSLSFVQGKLLDVEELFHNRINYCRPNKRYGIMWQQKVVPPFLKDVLADKEFTDEDLKKYKYYKYLVSRLNPQNCPDGNPDAKGVRHVLYSKMRDYIKLARDIRDNGLKAPIDLFCSDKPVCPDGKKWFDKVIIVRGSRRIAILHELGIKKVPARIWKSEWLAKRFIPDADWPRDDKTIQACAVRQFVKMGNKSTDKYWRHSYTHLYDRHIGKFQKGGHTKKILEIGVKTGVSLMLWHDAFPAGLIYGLDRDPEKCDRKIRKRRRIKVIKGDQTDKELLHKIARKYGPFHVVIDDGSHNPKHQNISFNVLWEYMEPGGVYVIEDAQCSFKKREKYAKHNIFPKLYSLVEDMYKKHTVRDVAFYPNLVFVTKA
jgi:hypothetical protein